MPRLSVFLCLSKHVVLYFQRSVTGIISGVQQYQNALLHTMRDTIQRIFLRHPDNIERVQEELLGALDHFQDPFATMATVYRQDKTIRELFSPVEPEEIVMSQKA